jgi:WD40 repeat protein
MIKRLALFTMILGLLALAASSLASNPSAGLSQSETDLVNDADAVIQRYNAALGQPRAWTYTFTTATNDGSLGCPLVASYNLGYYVTPYRMEITYPEAGPFVIYLGYQNATANPVVVPCDPALGVSAAPQTGTGGPTTPAQPEVFAVTCSATARLGSNAPITTQPNREGNFIGGLDDLSFATVIGRTADTSFYQVDVGGQTGWVALLDVILGGAGCGQIPVTSQVTGGEAFQASFPSLSGTGGPGYDCLLTAIRARVRGAPSLSAPIIDEVITGEVVGVNGQTVGAGINRWYQVDSAVGPGWVSSTVSTINGPGCATLAEVAGVSTTNAQGQTFQITTPPVQTGCPLNFAGYLAPRLQAGQQAAVTFDGLRVRTGPDAATTDANIVFEMPAGTIFNVLSGPVCNNNQVWWQVGLNNTIGWTAESDTVAGYYAEPRVQSPGIRFAEPLLGVNAEIGRVETGGQVARTTFSPDGESVAVANATDYFIRTWDTATGEDVQQAFLHRPDIRLSYIAYQPDGDLVATADLTRTVSVWQGDQLVNFIGGRVDPIFPGMVAVNPNWETVAISGCLESATGEGCLQFGINLIDMVSNEVVQTIETEAVRHIAWNGDGSTLAAAGTSGDVMIYGADGAEITTLTTGMERITALEYTPDGAQVALVGALEADAPLVVYLWDVESDSQTTVIEVGPSATTIAFSPDNTMLAIGNADNRVVLWDVPGNKELETFEGYVNGITSLSFSGDSQSLASGDGAGNLVLLNVGLE